MRRRLLVFLALASFVPASAACAAVDARTTTTYVRADLRLVRELVAELAVLRRQPAAVLLEVRGHCLNAGVGSPQDEQSTLLSDEVIGALVIRSDRAGAVAINRFLRATTQLHWRGSAARETVGGYVRSLAGLMRLPYPSLCRDVRAWAGQSFSLLSPFTRSFAPRFMRLWVAPGDLPPVLRRTENRKVRPLARRAAALELELGDWEAQAVETYTAVMNAMAIYP